VLSALNAFGTDHFVFEDDYLMDDGSQPYETAETSGMIFEYEPRPVAEIATPYYFALASQDEPTMALLRSSSLVKDRI
jgi:hypothetical protein